MPLVIGDALSQIVLCPLFLQLVSLSNLTDVDTASGSQSADAKSIPLFFKTRDLGSSESEERLA